LAWRRELWPRLGGDLAWWFGRRVVANSGPTLVPIVTVQVRVPQAHAPGAEAEVDFGEFDAVIAGVLAQLWMFVMRLSCSGRAFHVAFATQAQEAFLEGYVLAFENFGAVPGRGPVRQPQARRGAGAARPGRRHCSRPGRRRLCRIP
jgi:hypothetical protein